MHILDEAALIILPTLLGMVWAFQGKAKWRVEQLELMFTGRSSGFMEISDHLPSAPGNQSGITAATVAEIKFLKQYAATNVILKTRQVEKLMKIVSCIVNYYTYLCMCYNKMFRKLV